MVTLIFNLAALLCIAFIIWWFWLAKAKTNVAKENEIDIIVKDGVYEPSRITAEAGTSLTLKFLRKEHSPCSEFVVFDKLDIHQQLPVDKAFPITLNNLQPGTYKFTCQMGMYQGELIVK